MYEGCPESFETVSELQENSKVSASLLDDQHSRFYAVRQWTEMQNYNSHCYQTILFIYITKQLLTSIRRIKGFTL